MVDHVIRHVQVCIPFRLLSEKYLPMIIENRINPEIGIDGKTLDGSSEKEFSRIASILHQEGLSVTLHAPFYDLAPGAMDTLILKATRERLKQIFDLIPLFNPKTLVCHSGYDKKRYYNDQRPWLATSLETWTPLIENLSGTQTVLVIENVYEKNPDILLSLLDGLDKGKSGFCFDTGHMNAFSDTSMQGWLHTLGPYIRQLHLHDNDGTWDRHWALGAGKIDFEALFEYMNAAAIEPVITVEAHREDWMWSSFEALSRSHLFRQYISLRDRTVT
jgi:sugar phosphate isomerase/epimerase